MSKLVAFDVGTSSLKAVLYERDRGIVASADAEYGPEPAAHRQNADAWWRAAREAARKLDVDGVEAVVLSGTMENLILRDAEGIPLHSVLLYSNPCGTAHYEAMIRDLADVQPIIGNAPEPLMTAFKWRWFQQVAPGVVPRVRMVMAGAKDDLLFRMTGRAVTDAVTGSTTGLMDIATRDWSDEMLERFEIPHDVLPEILEPGALVGALRADAANHLGLRSGIPVINGCGDAGASMIGSFCDEPGDVSVYFGQSGWVARTVDFATIDDHRPVYRLAHPWRDLLIEVSPVDSITNALAWGQKIFGLTLDQAEAELQAADASPPQLVCLPYFSGQPASFNDVVMRGAFLGLDERHTPGDLYYALLEGICFSARAAVDFFDPSGASHFAMIGTGATSRVLPQLVADSMAYPVSALVHPNVSASLGACRIAAAVLGWPSPEKFERRDIAPRQDRAERVARLHEAFLRATDIARAFSPFLEP